MVCIKQVPDTEARIRVADGKLQENDLNWIVSPYDEFALEEALKIKEKKGGEVVLLSLGPERVVSALRSGLAESNHMTGRIPRAAALGASRNTGLLLKNTSM